MNPSMPPMAEHRHVEKPKGVRDVPRYLHETVGQALRRLFYVVSLVWETSRALLIAMLVLALVRGIMPLLGTLISANLLEQVVRSFSTSVSLILPLMWQFGYIFVNYITNSVDRMINRMAGEMLTNHVRVKIMEKAKTVDLASFDSPDFYARLENANREAGMRPVNMLSAAFEIISKCISVISFIAVLGGMLSKLGAWSIVFFVLFLLLSLLNAAISFYYRRRGFRYMRHRSKDRRQLDYYSGLLVDKDMVKEIRLFHLSDLLIGRYNDVFKGYFAGLKSLIFKESFWGIFLSFCTALMNGVLFYRIATHVTMVGDYSVYTGALSAIASAISVLLSRSALIYEGSLFMDNMILFLEEEVTIKPSLPAPLHPQRHIGHTIELKNVTFRYPGGTHDVLKNINLTFSAGQTTALVGLNGAGKTTLIKLITRLYDPTEGEILLDGQNIKAYDLDELYRLYGIVFQDFGKYAVSVRENIAFGDVEKPTGDVCAAAQYADAADFIERLPDGYDTPLMRYFEPDGTELSIGQWQKLSVARAFYRDADILILDEPTASLDALAEREIYRQFDRLRQNKTTIFVSHRLSSATTADRIVVLENGGVAECGTHEALMNARGQYYRLFTAQAERYRPEQ